MITTKTETQVDHRLFTEVLTKHVRAGFVDYKHLCTDQRLDQYIQALAVASPEIIALEGDRLAFWINAYNAYTLKVICDNYPLKSIRDLHRGGLLISALLKKSIWDKDLVIVGRKKLSLNTIEHGIIRKRFNEPRVHFALVCASESCPPLRSEAFEREKVDEQLNNQAMKFLSDPTKNHFDISKKVAHISPIFDWFSGDFGKSDTSILFFIAKFLPDNIANAIRRDPAAWKIKYTEYNWSLNSA